MAKFKEESLTYLFGDIIEKAGGGKLDVTNVKHYLRRIYGSELSRHINYFLDNFDDPKAKKILKVHRKKLSKRLAKEFFVIKNNNTVKIIRRPEILKGYTVRGKVYLAISERKLITGIKGKIMEVDLVYFPILPLPNRKQLFTHTCVNEWECSTYLVSEYLEDNFLPREYVPQRDVFQDKELNYLIYENFRLKEVIPSHTEEKINFQKKKVLEKPVQKHETQQSKE